MMGGGESAGHERRLVRVSTFGGASSLPLFVAQERGFFEVNGLAVEITVTTGSHELMQGLVDGAFAVVHAAPDNFVAWRDRTAAEVVAWIGGTSGPVRLVAEPSVGQIRDLAGRSIAVDAQASGFVSVLRKLLRADGLADDDVELVPLGSTRLRFDALMAGQTPATMLTLPWSALATDKRFRSIGDQGDVLPRLQGSCAGSLAGWLAANPVVADAYLRSICASLTWCYTPGNEQAVTTVVAKRYGLEARLADQIRREIIDPIKGWPPSGMIDSAGLEAVCDLRRENGTPPELPVAAYISFEPYRRVFGFGDQVAGDV